MAEPALRAAVVACGGTGGHVYPAIAIARALMERHPEATLSFVGRSASFEADAVAREGFAFDALSIGRLVGQGLAQKARTLAQIPVAIARAAGALARRRPSVVIGTGGFVSGPTVLAAALRRIPIVVQEQNAIPGLTNRVLCAVASRVALAHEREGAQPPKYRVTGNPVRPAFLAVPDWTERDPFALLVLGGSQGARRLNEVVISAARLLQGSRLRVVLQCGPSSLEWCREQAQGLPIDVQPFLHDMPERLAAASLVVSRSGASTIAELCASGRPSLLVPFPHAAADHQTANAVALARAGAADFIAERDLSPEILAERLRAALGDPARLRKMAGAARSLARPDAAAAVAKLAEEVASP
jgi:UDP-N-acetylglucosamine--N-acetylmuramyl-(pentapeptide) pyrophosphoryl-undecaprenol N-acetylglucosamine transferase